MKLSVSASRKIPLFNNLHLPCCSCIKACGQCGEILLVLFCFIPFRSKIVLPASNWLHPNLGLLGVTCLVSHAACIRKLYRGSKQKSIIRFRLPFRLRRPTNRLWPENFSHSPTLVLPFDSRRWREKVGPSQSTHQCFARVPASSNEILQLLFQLLFGARLRPRNFKYLKQHEVFSYRAKAERETFSVSEPRSGHEKERNAKQQKVFFMNFFASIAPPASHPKAS